MSRRRRSDYRLSLGWILGVTFIGTLTRLKLPQWSSLSFGAAVCLRLPPHTTSQRKLSRLATDHATCSCLRLTVATNSPRKGLSPPIQCPCRAHQFRRAVSEVQFHRRPRRDQYLAERRPLQPRWRTSEIVCDFAQIFSTFCLNEHHRDRGQQNPSTYASSHVE